MPLRQALITYDPDRLLSSSSAESTQLNWIFQRALSFEDYPRERGIVSIRHIPEGNEMIVVPVDGTDLLMSFNPCVTLTLDLVERLVALAERGAGVSGADRDVVRHVKEEVAGTRKRFETVQVVAVPRMTHDEAAALNSSQSDR